MSRPIVLTSPMDGSPQVVCFDTTTLWHLDAAEWAPSTASKASEIIGQCGSPCPRCPESGHRRPRSRCDGHHKSGIHPKIVACLLHHGGSAFCRAASDCG